MGGVGEGALADVGDAQVGDGRREERRQVGEGDVRAGEAEEDEMGLVALEGEADDLVGIAGAAGEQQDRRLVRQVGGGRLERQEGAQFVAEHAFDDVAVGGGRRTDGGDERRRIDVEIKQGLARAVGDAQHEAVLGGRRAIECRGGFGQGEGDAGVAIRQGRPGGGRCVAGTGGAAPERRAEEEHQQERSGDFRQA